MHDPVGSLRVLRRYRLTADIGGTFTDLVAASDNGRILEVKVPSDAARPESALEAALDLAAGKLDFGSAGDLLEATDLVIHGTTVAVNALLQGTGARTGLLCTEGFKGYARDPPWLQGRAVQLRLPTASAARASTFASSRGWASGLLGSIRLPLSESDVAQACHTFGLENVESVAICFLWSFQNPDHERRAAEIVQELLPNVFISLSVDVLPRMREYDRTSTTVLNAYVGPVVNRYVARTEQMLRQLGFAGRIRYVQSNGGLAEADEIRRRPVVLIQSGPAAAPAAALQFKRPVRA